MGSYIGPDNPKTYGNKSLGIEPSDSYQYKPRNLSEYAAIAHDKAYDKVGAQGVNGALIDKRVMGADANLA